MSAAAAGLGTAAALLFALVTAAGPSAVEGRRFPHGDDSSSAAGGGSASSSQTAGWTYGRATNYNTINVGSCGYGAIGDSAITGQDVAASCEKNSDFSGSCGRCYEVQCVASTVKDRDAPR